jgi:hypothetical protein
MWAEAHQYCIVSGEIEPDSPRWEAAVALSDAVYKWQNYFVYGTSNHPLDDSDPHFSQFVERPPEVGFQPWRNMRLDVSNSVQGPLWDDRNVETYYTTWQLLLAAEVADAGIHIRLNLADDMVWRESNEALTAGRLPTGRGWRNLLPVHAMREFLRHKPALDAAVRFAEESQRALVVITKHKTGRFRLSESESEFYIQNRRDIARESALRYSVSSNDLVQLARFLSRQWSDWDRDGRPLIADGYKSFLGQTVLLIRVLNDGSLAEVREGVGRQGGWHVPSLDVIWPDWVKEEKKRMQLILMESFKEWGECRPDRRVIDMFVAFLAEKNQEAVFWRVHSFEEHALRGNEFATEGMRSDLQGLAVAVEHVIRSLGSRKGQLYEMFKELWKGSEVGALLKEDGVSRLGRQSALQKDWSALKQGIQGLRAKGQAGRVAADLVMASRIRGGVHESLPEADHFELERLFVDVLRAVVVTFAHARKEILFPP